MILFGASAIALVAIALVWLLPTLLRKGGHAEPLAADKTSLSILREQLDDLKQDLDNGTLSPHQYQQAREDLERRALEDGRKSGAATVSTSGGHRRTALAIGIALPVCAALIYSQLGNPEAVVAPGMAADTAQGVSPEQVAAMVKRLEARLEKEPQDATGWALLARSYVVMQRYPEAVAAYARAAALLPNNADVLADYADAVAMSKGRRLDDESIPLLERALKIDPMQWKALALAGTAAFERKDYKTAISYWEKLQSRAEPGSEFARSLASTIQEARELGGIKATAGTAELTAAAPSGASPATGDASVKGTVSLSGKLAGKTNPDDTVFVFARAADGPRMPLAIIRRQVKDLPLTFSLDDSMSMSPEMKLSKFKQVVIGARISKSGNAAPQSGDLQGMSKTVNVGDNNVAIVVDSLVP
jgi:cytochrome c-type biogenesis protein CcmH